MTPATDAWRAWERDGFFILPGFAEPECLDAMVASITALARAAAVADTSIAPAYIQVEGRLAQLDVPAERKLSKLFRVHREHAVFRDFCRAERVREIVTPILGPDVDCFLSQFIFKHPGAMGQPWHQDAWYFPFDRRPQVGLWLAVSEATLDNGPLWVLPGSHREPVHDVVADRRPHANFGYVEIVDQDFGAAVPVLMQRGDLLVFHAHLMHRSTDNASDGARAAMVFHYGAAGTVDRSVERFGFVPKNIDWMPVFRRSDGVAAPRRLERIISGGQTGADRGALDAAIALGIPHGGRCPRGRRAEDGEIPACYALEESASEDYKVRTRENVESADGTLILSRGTLSGGSLLTAQLAEQLGKPLLIVDLGSAAPRLAAEADELDAWLLRHGVRTLNVAGPRESEAEGIGEQARAFLAAALGGSVHDGS